MIDFLNPNIFVISGVIGVLIFLWFIQLSIDDDNLVWLIWVPMAFIALYLLWVGGSWLVPRFM
jgi:high-affinity Fe2+/Pb2+ permease